MNGKILQRYEELACTARQFMEKRDLANKIVIQVGSATCENAAGAKEVFSEFKKHVEASGRSDIAIHKVGCTGRCSCEPIVNVIVPGKFPVKYQCVDRELVHRIFTQHILGGTPLEDAILDKSGSPLVKYDLLFCTSDRCRKNFPGDIIEALNEQLAAVGLNNGEVIASQASCFGLCRRETSDQPSFMLVRPAKIVYRLCGREDLAKIVREHLRDGKIVEELRVKDEPIAQRFFDLFGDVAFFNKQSRIALRNSGIIDPESIEEYIHCHGFEALARVLDKNNPDWVINEVTESKLRGRGGGGYPTGKKWALGRASAGDVKYNICNADEGDPGAFMDRSMLEGDPMSVIEGMIIGAFAIGAHKGFVYIRAEYPMAIRRLELAIESARKHGLLGDNIMGSDFSYDIEIRLGAGAFVCGEET
ncbi:MAG TPA: NADH-quinone oxidoreductase subunit E, partial [Phycisphaerae bacterium]|nr:NADH-quinone oxidoreductase subunit E [Phycisphaerae bacterium]